MGIENNKLKAFVEYGRHHVISIGNILSGTLLYLLFSIPCAFIGLFSWPLLILALGILPVFIWLSIRSYQMGKESFYGPYLSNAVSMICYTVFTFICSLRILTLIDEHRAAIITIMVIIFFIATIVYYVAIYLMIKRGIYENTKKASKHIMSLVIFGFGAFGIGFARIITAEMDQQNILILLASLLLVLSLCCMMGTPNLFKFVLAKKHHSEWGY